MNETTKNSIIDMAKLAQFIAQHGGDVSKFVKSSPVKPNVRVTKKYEFVVKAR